LRKAFEAWLRAILDPELVDKQAKAGQARMAEQFGGFEALRRREKMAFTPPPTAATR
jgi:choline-sulfatase